MIFQKFKYHVTYNYVTLEVIAFSLYNSNQYIIFKNNILIFMNNVKTKYMFYTKLTS